MHLQASEQLKMYLKKSSTTTNIFDKSHDVMLKLNKNWKETYLVVVFSSTSLIIMIEATSFPRLLLSQR